MVERGGFEPPKAAPADLQSAPFGRSGTSPWSHRRESNPRPADYKSAALPAELRWLHHSPNYNKGEKDNTNPFLLEFELNYFYYKKVNGNNSSITSIISIFLVFFTYFEIFGAISQKQIYRWQRKHLQSLFCPASG